MKLIFVAIALLASIPRISAQDMMAVAGGAFAFSAPFRVACPYTTNGVTATIIGAFASETNRELPLVLRQYGTKISIEFYGADFARSEDAKRNAKAAGIDNVIVVMDTEKSNILFLFPNLAGFVEVEPSSKLADAVRQMSRIRVNKVEQGNDWIDGHWCAKVGLRDPGSLGFNGTMWQRFDLHDFPVKIELISEGDVMKIVAKTVEFSKPPMTYFEAPRFFKHYSNFSELMAFAKKRFDERGGGGSSR